MASIYPVEELGRSYSKPYPWLILDAEVNYSGLSMRLLRFMAGLGNRGKKNGSSELEAFSKAVQGLEQVKDAIAGRCMVLLLSPTNGLLDVVEACSVGSF